MSVCTREVAVRIRGGEEVMTGKEVVSTALAGSEDLRETGIKPHATMGEWLSRGWSICFFFNNFFFLICTMSIY